VATLLAVVAGVVGAVELSGRRIMVLQCDRETPRRWVDRGAVRWAVKTGMALGVGGTTRIGFWLWFVVPLGVFLVGDVAAAGAIYGTYAVVRGLGPIAVILAGDIMSSRAPSADPGWWLDRQGETARLVASAQLVVVGVAIAGIVGF
jgi:hypothetical protein